ncbi:hypothetical protein [Streptomyces sp. NPDC058066]|uniref:hypothetical protein n=1 Tax=Streptomyces sp. NPDC058066 TaxID=3346323 RepID=UPI0036E698F8
MAALTGLLVRACCKLLPARELVPLWREHRGGAVVLTVTAFAIVATNLFKGVLVGLAPAVARTAWDISHVQVRTEDRGLGLRGCEAAGLVARVAGTAPRFWGRRSCSTRSRRCLPTGTCGWNWVSRGVLITRAPRRWRESGGAGRVRTTVS